ncbi:MAG: IclR family transcriptional regulator, regulon repressor [Deferribacteres bacterium]|nr:IclR family transcriptional regulator [Deferribacteraceae bacterium]MDK2791554.1 IclR family transcriptional regulator, regulon repressor [Deferribacteres bacterium]
MKRDKTEYAVQAVNNAIDILEFLGDCDNELSVSEIGARLGLTRSNVNKLLATLESFGYVEHNRYTGNFRLGVKTFQIAQAYLNKLSLIDISMQFLTELRDLTGESAYISVLRGSRVVYLNLVETNKSVRVLPRIGNVGPAYATATGKAQMAFMDKKDFEKYFAQEKLVKITNNTIDNYDELVKEIEDVRKNGFAIDDEEYEIGVRCVGAPVFNFMGKVIAGISISAPKERLTKEKMLNEISQMVKSVAQRLSVKFGYRG